MLILKEFIFSMIKTIIFLGLVSKCDVFGKNNFHPTSIVITDANSIVVGHKFRWPELVGKNGQQAKAVIQKDNPLVTVVVLPPGRVGFANFCCNRVYLVLGRNGNVLSAPMVG